MLACQGGGYALCFFSGPPAGIFGGQALPCILGRDGLTANCTCQYYSSGTYYVDINGILNQGAYFGAVKQCGPDGSGCSNITSQSNTSLSLTQATVCTYVNNQSLGNAAGSFYPNAKDRVQAVSTFSFAMSPPKGNYQLPTQKNPPATCTGKYAGCMTAACRFKDGQPASAHHNGDAIQCECPVYDGTYQVGASGQTCPISSSDGKTYVWSASNTVVPSASDSKK
jgi:hypothetical protein